MRTGEAGEHKAHFAAFNLKNVTCDLQECCHWITGRLLQKSETEVTLQAAGDNQGRADRLDSSHENQGTQTAAGLQVCQ